jgi:DNA-binding LytR/AlgR family response regulator
MILKCLIVDDEPPAIKIIENYLSKLQGMEIVGTAANAIEAFNQLQANKVDILFLDVNMPEISGINLLKIIKDPPVVILTTAYSEYALESYEYNVTDYLLKPIRFERFIQAIEKAKTVKQLKPVEPVIAESTHFEFKVNGCSKKIPFKEILYLQSLGNYIKVFTTLKSYVVLLSTKEAEGMLPKSKFVRIHKSFIINMTRVTEHDHEFVTLETEKLPIGKTYKKFFLEKRGSQ